MVRNVGNGSEAHGVNAMSSTCESCGCKLTINQIESGQTSCVECNELWHERLCSDEVREGHAMRKGNTPNQDREIHKTTHGGYRPGSGRKPTGRKRLVLSVTDEERAKIIELLAQLRATKN